MNLKDSKGGENPTFTHKKYIYLHTWWIVSGQVTHVANSADGIWGVKKACFMGQVVPLQLIANGIHMRGIFVCTYVEMNTLRMYCVRI